MSSTRHLSVESSILHRRCIQIFMEILYSPIHVLCDSISILGYYSTRDLLFIVFYIACIANRSMALGTSKCYLYRVAPTLQLQWTDPRAHHSLAIPAGREKFQPISSRMHVCIMHARHVPLPELNPPSGELQPRSSILVQTCVIRGCDVRSLLWDPTLITVVFAL